MSTLEQDSHQFYDDALERLEKLENNLEQGDPFYQILNQKKINLINIRFKKR
jgi:hypothetical protein